MIKRLWTTLFGDRRRATRNVHCELRAYTLEGELWQSVPFDLVDGTNATEVFTKTAVRPTNLRVYIWHPELGEVPLTTQPPTLSVGGQVVVDKGTVQIGVTST